MLILYVNSILLNSIPLAYYPGYMRGDGCSGVTLKWGDMPEES